MCAQERRLAGASELLLEQLVFSSTLDVCPRAGAHSAR